MSRVTTVLIIIILLVACVHEDSEWEVTFGWSSGWGSSPVYKVNSEGKMERIKPYLVNGNMICVQKLNIRSLSQIRSKIDSVPSTIPKETNIAYLDNCSDERENYIFITKGQSQQGFSYSQSVDCRRSKIPSWLENLNDELMGLKNTIDDC